VWAGWVGVMSDWKCGTAFSRFNVSCDGGVVLSFGFATLVSTHC